MRLLRGLAAVLVFLVLATARPVFAWGPEGHQALSALAETLLTEEARKELQALLGELRLSDADICLWADNVRKDLKNGQWHYINIPFDAKDYVPVRDDHEGGSIIERLRHFTGVLKDKKAKKEDRLTALKYVVHFVGDLHMPLHAIARDNDKGGNLCKVFMPGKPEETNLHKVWDIDFVIANTGKALAAVYGEKNLKALADKLTADERKKIEAGEFADWALESHTAAREHAYAGVKSGDTLTEAYAANAAKIANDRLLRGGLRLARVLNEAFAAEAEKTAQPEAGKK